MATIIRRIIVYNRRPMVTLLSIKRTEVCVFLSKEPFFNCPTNSNLPSQHIDCSFSGCDKEHIFSFVALIDKISERLAGIV